MMKTNFKLGDKVVVIDDDLEGVITSIDNNEITIETLEGFALSFFSHELIKKKRKALDNNMLSGFKASVILEKEEQKPKKSQRVSPKDRKKPPMEVDLHIHQLITSEKGLTAHDKKIIQLDTAKHKLEFAMANNIQRIVFIHGVGDGVLKLELEYLFKRYEGVSFQDADYRKYGLGATEVYIHQNPKTSPNFI